MQIYATVSKNTGFIPMSGTSISIRVEGVAGSSRQEMEADMKVLANKLVIAVVSDFNGHSMLAFPGDDAVIYFPPLRK